MLEISILSLEIQKASLTNSLSKIYSISAIEQISINFNNYNKKNNYFFVLANGQYFKSASNNNFAHYELHDAIIIAHKFISYLKFSKVLILCKGIIIFSKNRITF